MAKFRMKEVEAALATIHQAIADFRADAAAEKAAAGEGTASDNPPEFPGKPAAQDRAIDPWAQGQFGVKPKGLTHVPNTAATRALEKAIPALGRLRGKY